MEEVWDRRRRWRRCATGGGGGGGHDASARDSVRTHLSSPFPLSYLETQEEYMTGLTPNRQTGRQADRQTDIKTGRQTETDKRETDKETDRQADSQPTFVFLLFLFPLPLFLLLLLLFLLLLLLLLVVLLLVRGAQQGEDDAGLRVHPHSRHQHLPRALHHMGAWRHRI